MFIPFDQIDLEKIKKEIEEDRKKVKEILEGKIAEKVKDLVKTVLFIVESPNKARTIANFFGKPTHRKIGSLDVYEVTLGDKYLIIVATKGHVVDLTTDEIGYYGVLLENNRFIPYYTSIKRCKKCGYQWTSDKSYDSCPRCNAPKEFTEDSKERLEVLKKLAQEADVILIGTDPDSITGDMKVKVLIDGKIEEKAVEELFNEWKENPDFEFFIKDEHEYLKPKKEIYVLGVDPEKLTVTWTKVNYFIRHKVKKPIYEIKTKSGKVIKVTGDHSLFTLKIKYEPVDLEGRTINIILFEEDFQKLTQKRPLFDKIIYKQEISQEEISEFLDKVGGVYTKVFIENLRIPAPVYFAGIDRNTQKRIFSLLLKEKRKLKEVRASELKIGDKIVIIENNRVILDEIIEIKTIVNSEIYVYDFDTETDNFIANDVLCHNTEGEFIAWSVYNAIKPYSKEIYRAEFHEVTKTAILKAIQEVLNLNLNRVKAQIVRRVEDRWIGFALSKKIQNLFKRKTLSAGRVQTPVLGWIIKRFEEHRQSIQYFITLKAGPFTILVDELKIKTKKEADEILKKLQEKEIIIKEKKYYEEEVNPLPPYITNTMLNDAIRELKIGASEVMQLAQDLFEWGLCLKGNAKILTPFGEIKIKEIIKRKIKEVHDQRILYYWRISYKGYLIRIKSEIGDIYATPDHLLLTKNGWKPSILINQNDVLYDPKLKEIKILDISLKRFSGYVYDITTEKHYFIANGIISHNCTYHRTDSTRVSPVGIALAKEYISQKWGEEYFKGRTWGTGGAHECIRPTKPYDPDTLYRMILEGEIKLPGQFTKRHLRLYSLIFWRFIASQMKPTKVKKVKYVIEIPEINLTKEIEGIVEIIEHGWDLVLPKYFEERKIEDINVTEIPIEKIDVWKGAKITLYTQADVISLMRERGIGRPSTYAQIMQKLLDRKYVIETKRKKLVPTSLGIKVYYYLDHKYHKLVSEERTRELEKKMDLVEEGLIDYQKVLWETYGEMQEVERTKDDIEELRKILKDKFEEFKKRARIVAKTRKFKVRRKKIK